MSPSPQRQPEQGVVVVSAPAAASTVQECAPVQGISKRSTAKNDGDEIRNKYALIFGILITTISVAAMIVIVVLIVLLLGNDNEGDGDEDEIGIISDPVEEEDMITVDPAVIAQWLAPYFPPPMEDGTNELIFPSSSLQREALLTLTLRDPRVYQGNLLNMTVTEVMCRYILTLFFIATTSGGRASWNNKRFWLSNEEVCDWEHIQCRSNTNEIIQIRLRNSQLQGSIPTELALLTQLTKLDLSRNNLQGMIPSELGLLSQLNHIDLSHNGELSGTIPLELFSWDSALLVARFSNNQLTGTIPSTVYQATNLEYLYMDKNLITGTISTEIGLLRQLKEVRFSKLQLTGTIPTEVGRPTKMSTFRVEKNLLTGTIPTELGYLTQMNIFRFNANQLTGSIPSELGLLTTASELHFTKNSLSGTIPTELYDLYYQDVLVVVGNPNVVTLPPISPPSTTPPVYSFVSP